MHRGTAVNQVRPNPTRGGARFSRHSVAFFAAYMAPRAIPSFIARSITNSRLLTEVDPHSRPDALWIIQLSRV